MIIKNLSKLYVLDVIESVGMLESVTTSIEEEMVLKDRICQKEENEKKKIAYRDIETNKSYTTKNGILDESAIVSLSSYYNILGFRKKNGYSNQEVVHTKVKSLKKQRKI